MFLIHDETYNSNWQLLQNDSNETMQLTFLTGFLSTKNIGKQIVKFK